MANPPLWQLPDSAAETIGTVYSSMRPPTIRRAVSLIRAGAALSVAYGIAEDLFVHSTTVGGRPASMAYSVGQFVGGIIVGLVLGAIWLWMAAKVGAGRDWARILSTVFFGFWCLQLIISLAVAAVEGGTAGSVAVFVVTLAAWIVGLVALISLWQAESSRYFAASPGSL